MTSAQMAHSATVSPSRTRGLLVETMQLVEPKKHVPVPNHLLDSKIYSKVAFNSIIQANPAVVHFGGFKLGKTHKQIVQISNVSANVQRMHIIPPQTNFFYVKYTKGDRLVPGLTLDCVIEFTPDEWRYYYDCIRIHTPGEENLVIPIHAYPVMDTSDWPEYLTFSPVPVGHTSSKLIPIKCHAPIDFEYGLSILQHHPAFTVQPMSGVVPANGEVDIIVTFTPTEFSTANMKLQLKTSQFNAKPLVCNISGSSIPGLAKQITQAITEENEGEELETRVMSPLDRARRNKKKVNKKAQTAKSTVASTTGSEEVEYAGIRFPQNLDTPYAVTQVLVQEPGKLRIKDLRDVIEMKKGKSSAQTRQMKEAMFEMAVRQDVYEERQNQLRWQVKLGDDQIQSDSREEILDNRELAWREYKVKRGDPILEKEYLRNCNKNSFRRTRRDCADVAPEEAKFDTYTNDMWAVRHSALSTFQQAAWKIMLRNRAEKKLASLRDMVLNWGKQGFSVTDNTELTEKDKADEEELESLANYQLEVNRVTSFTFPTYAPPNVKDDMAVDALGQVPYKPTQVVVKHKVQYQGLKVPQQYRLMGYKRHNEHEASLNYVPATLMRKLRVGAEDELINLATPCLTDQPQQETAVAVQEKQDKESVEKLSGSRSTIPPKSTTTIPGSKSTIPESKSMAPEFAVVEKKVMEPLKPPKAMFKPIEYPSLHIFNPAPGLQVFQPPMMYSETEPDFHLCPLPRYTSDDKTNPHKSTQKNYLDREDVIRGVMNWKRFPSQGLTSLSSTPTLTNVWVPRWNDVFDHDLLPVVVPKLQDQLDQDELENIDDEDDEDKQVAALTPEMISTEFHLVDTSRVPTPDQDKKNKDQEMFPYSNRMPLTNVPVSSTGPVPREKREQELAYFMKKKYNRLGQKFKARADQINSLKTNESLVLK